MKTHSFKEILAVSITVAVFAILFIVSLVYNVKAAQQSEKLKKITGSLEDYYCISCPDGGALTISEEGRLKYLYKTTHYKFDLYDGRGYTRKYKSETDISGNTKFYMTGLFSGPSGKCYRTDFPQCVIIVNDVLDIQRFFYPAFDDSEIETKLSSSGKMYLSFEHSITYSEALEWMEDIKPYGIVTWLWVDTYGQNDMSCNPITLENPYDARRYSGSELLPVHGIPLYYNGECIENPLENFLEILNRASGCDDDNPIDRELYNIRLGINDSKDVLGEEEIAVIGMVVLPNEKPYKGYRDEIFEAFGQMDNIKCCN